MDWGSGGDAPHFTETRPLSSDRVTAVSGRKGAVQGRKVSVSRNSFLFASWV